MKRYKDLLERTPIFCEINHHQCEIELAEGIKYFRQPHLLNQNAKYKRKSSTTRLLTTLAAKASLSVEYKKTCLFQIGLKLLESKQYIQKNIQKFMNLSHDVGIRTLLKLTGPPVKNNVEFFKKFYILAFIKLQAMIFIRNEIYAFFFFLVLAGGAVHNIKCQIDP